MCVCMCVCVGGGVCVVWCVSVCVVSVCVCVGGVGVVCVCVCTRAGMCVRGVCACVRVKFCCKLVKNFTQTIQLLNQAYGEDCMSRTQCCEWFKRFNRGKMSVGEDPRPGRPSTSTKDDHVERVRAVIRGNRRLTVREVADEVGISIGSCHQIFTEKLKDWKNHINKIVPRLNGVCFVIRSVYCYSNMSTVRIIYFAYFHAIMECGIIFWRNLTDGRKVFLQQKWIIRTVAG